MAPPSRRGHQETGVGPPGRGGSRAAGGGAQGEEPQGRQQGEGQRLGSRKICRPQARGRDRQPALDSPIPEAVFTTKAAWGHLHEGAVTRETPRFALGEEEARPPCTRAGGGAATRLRLDEVPRAGRVYYAVTPRPPPNRFLKPADEKDEADPLGAFKAREGERVAGGARITP